MLVNYGVYIAMGIGYVAAGFWFCEKCFFFLLLFVTVVCFSVVDLEFEYLPTRFSHVLGWFCFLGMGSILSFGTLVNRKMLVLEH